MQIEYPLVGPKEHHIRTTTIRTIVRSITETQLNNQTISQTLTETIYDYTTTEMITTNGEETTANLIATQTVTTRGIIKTIPQPQLQALPLLAQF